jgi:hypothetical protein
MHRILLLIAFGALSFAAHASNLVQNPDFDDGDTGWSLADGPAGASTGSIAIEESQGLPTAPSLHVLGDGDSTGVVALSACIEVDDSTNFDLHAFVKPASGTISVGVAAFSDTTCGATIDVVSSDPIGSNSIWQSIGFDDRPLPDGTVSVQVYLAGVYGPMGSIGDALFDHVEFGPTGTLPEDGIAFQEGLTGTWYNPLTSGQGFEFSVMTPDTPGGQALLFGTWYTYDIGPSGGPETQRWYSVQATIAPGATHSDVGIYRNVNGNFDAGPPTHAEQVGTGMLTFFTCNAGLFTYAFDGGPAGAIPLQPLLGNVECSDGGAPAAATASDFGFSGAWYDTATSGQGLMVEVDPVDAEVFVGWYTYALDGANADDQSQRWLTAQSPYDVGSTSMDLDLYVTTGGSLDSNLGPIDTVAVGTATLTFTSCTTATYDYEITSGEFAGSSGTIDLTRLGPSLQSCAFAQ